MDLRRLDTGRVLAAPTVVMVLLLLSLETVDWGWVLWGGLGGGGGADSGPGERGGGAGGPDPGTAVWAGSLAGFFFFRYARPSRRLPLAWRPWLWLEGEDEAGAEGAEVEMAGDEGAGAACWGENI